ncbi:heme exporter protein CcmB [Pelomonas sp. APW6]|uniref:Heme exporter protein B n=1 Tax=Roseateles subflavus TaxID=3053353 RepID=A0ABT7LH11_9BURK|nr:heme exporter protein CcmB [Pelomonas sp. APW6]MDL5031719.1 heme exporter protein CcmB [Pelomonas sp. APW6]
MKRTTTLLPAAAAPHRPVPRLSPLHLILRRDARLLWRRPADAALALGFFALAAALQPLGLSPDPTLLKQIAPGVLWVAALLSALLPLPTLFAGDQADGTLEQVLLSRLPLWHYALARVCFHWLASGAPLVLIAPVLGALYGLPADELLMLSAGLLLGTPVLSLVGGLAAALTLGLRSAGTLILLIVLPLMVPVLVFGTTAVQALQAGQSASPHLSLLGADLIVSAMGLPWLIGRALLIAQD